MNKILFIVLLMASIAVSQQKDSVTVVPNPEYEAGSLHKFLFGEHWRELWTTPVKVEVLDINTFAGGLAPLSAGGGMQTKSLKFMGKDGRIWKFRSVNKDPSSILPEDLRKTVVDHILQDQISSANPVAPLVVAPILDAIGILQAKPQLFWLPDTPELGRFREQFGGMLGMIEVHPDEPEFENEAGFENADKIKGTYKLLNTLVEKRSNRVNVTDYLKARLADMYLNDWDRHSDQWRWARYDSGDVKYWSPIPRDRDQAFSKYDGLAPRVATMIVPQLSHFDYSYPPIRFLTWNGRHVDRRFLPLVTKAEWDSVTAYVYDRLTDELIENAVKKMPPEYYSIAAEELVSKLKERRDRLPEISEKFYRLINTITDFYASDDDDYVVVNRSDDLHTEVTAYRYDEDKDEPYGKPYRSRIFDNRVTEEIRIYLGDEEDKAVVRGRVNTGPLVKIAGDDDKDIFIDSSYVKGKLWGFLPIETADNKTWFYDHGNGSVFEKGAGTLVVTEEYPEPETDRERYEPAERNRWIDYGLMPEGNITSYDGIILTLGAFLTKYNFRSYPYDYRTELTIDYATLPQSFRFYFQGSFNSIRSKAMFGLEAEYNALAYYRFYGYGNETDFDESLEDADYYRTKNTYLMVRPRICINRFSDMRISFSSFFESNDYRVVNPELLETFPDKGYGTGKFSLAGLSAEFFGDTRDRERNPYSGYYVNLSSTYYPKLFDNEKVFWSAGFDMRKYFSWNWFRNTTLALRAGGKKNWGKFPFFKSVFLGGSDDLRGYTGERFAGNAALWGQSELRMFLSRINILIKGNFGVHVFGETGRVFTNKGNSDKWHPSAGGGIWTSYIDRDLTFSLTAAHSPEDVIFILRAEMGF